MPLEFKQAVLDNGLTIVGEADPDAHTAAIGFFVKTGARDEDAEVMGVSLYLEHMMFKGTATRAAADVDKDFDAIGADHNAFTTSEMTAFWCHCLPEYLPRGQEILADILRPALREDDFNDEKKVILEEIAMYQDQPFWMLYERAMESYYDTHPLRHRVLGTSDTVTATTCEQMKTYFDERYSADNTMIALAGAMDFDTIVERLQDQCGHWPCTDTHRQYPDHTPGRERFKLESAKVNRQYLLMLCPAPAMTDERRYAAAMLMQILGNVDGSRLYWALVETGLAEEAQAQHDPRDGVGDYLIYCSCSPNDADKVERIALEEAAKLPDTLTADDLDRVRSRVVTAATLQGELPAGRMRRLGRLWTYAGEYRSLDSELERMNAVTLDDLRAVYAAFPCKPTVIGALAPGDEKGE